MPDARVGRKYARRPPAGRVRSMSPSADRGEEAGGWSVPKAKLPFQPHHLPYIPDGGGGGGVGKILEGPWEVWISPMPGVFKSLKPSWGIPKEAEHVVLSPVFWYIPRPI